VFEFSWCFCWLAGVLGMSLYHLDSDTGNRIGRQWAQALKCVSLDLKVSSG
jgi:hypothetical protein